MTTASFAVAFKGEGTERLELDIFDAIGSDFWGEGVTAKKVRATLKANASAKTIVMTVNSRGGDCVDGMAIYSMLQEHPARVIAEVPGLAASMASIILMAADEINVAEGAMIMIHCAWGGVFGTPEAMRRHADTLDSISETMAGIYAHRTGQTKDRIVQMMADETWMTAAEAKRLGFADTVRPAKKGAGQAHARAFASLRLDGLASVPESLRKMVERAREEIGDANARRQSYDCEPTSEPEGQETEMADDVKTILATLGVASVQEAAARLSILARIETAVGKTGDEAHGVVLAALASHANAPKLQARIAELEKSAEGSALDALIAKAKDEKKLTPALEKTVRDQFAAGDITLKGAEAFLANLTAVGALSPRQPAKPDEAGASGAATWNGKTYAELKPAQRAALKKENPELFEAMRTSAQQ